MAKIIDLLADGRLESSNNRSERAIKRLSLAEKHGFADNVEGAKATAIIYSLIETYKQHHVEPYHW